MTAREAAELWGISQRRVQVLCGNGRVSGAERLGNDMWVIPCGTSKPLDGRTKAAKQQRNSSVLTRDVERLIGEVDGTMAIEGMPLTDEDKERLRLVLSGEVTADEMVQRLVAKHRRSENVGRVRI
ncbi:MAG: antitoxin VbhA family protein [Oscillospiraceae bacterium]|nr:antitoxin VbhA family protein [Oscillospiraceae bacterium]